MTDVLHVVVGITLIKMKDHLIFVTRIKKSVPDAKNVYLKLATCDKKCTISVKTYVDRECISCSQIERVMKNNVKITNNWKCYDCSVRKYKIFDESERSSTCKNTLVCPQNNQHPLFNSKVCFKCIFLNTLKMNLV